MDETALAILVFDGQKDDVLETLGTWDRDLTRASKAVFSKLLVAGRVDAGGLRISRSHIETFRKERRLKEEGRVLMRFNELRETLHLRVSGGVARFTDEELKAVVGLLAGPGVLWELKFGSWILLQPERINAYAQAVIQTMRADEDERGCLAEQRVLGGDLAYSSSLARLERDEEQFVLFAMHQTLVAVFWTIFMRRWSSACITRRPSSAINSGATRPTSRPSPARNSASSSPATPKERVS